MTVTLLEILAAARAHVAPLAAESAGYLLLAVADNVALAPRIVGAEDVELSPDGTVRLRARGSGAADSRGVEQAVRLLLARALDVASSVGPSLRRAATRADEAGLASLVRELENALIPVNRSAAKRALSRLHRETARARDAGKLEAWLQAEAAEPAAENVVLAAEFPEPSPAVLPSVVAAPVVAPAPAVPARAAAVLEAVPTPQPAVARPVPAAPAVELTLTPEPLLACGEPALTKPEPVVLRAKTRGSSTPKLGTVVTAQTLPGEEVVLTERAPTVTDEAPLEPEPSRMPDVLMAMVTLHAGLEPDEAPTRLRDVVTSVRANEPTVTPEPQQVDDAWLTKSSLDGVETSAPSDRAIHEAVTWNPGAVAPVAPVVTRVVQVVAPVAPVAPVAAASAGDELEPSPYAPAALATRPSDVSELLDSFYVSGATEERELRSALKEMAGLSLTPMPHPYIEER